MKNKDPFIVGTAAFAALCLIIAAIVLFSKGENRIEHTVVCSSDPAYVLAMNLLDGTGCNVLNLADGKRDADEDLPEPEAFLTVGGELNDVSAINAMYPDLAVICISDAHSEESNPHIWLNADFMADCIDYVSAALIDRFPDIKDRIKNNARRYLDSVFNGPYNKKLELTEKLESRGDLIRCICFGEDLDVFAASVGIYSIAVLSDNETGSPTAEEIENAAEKAKKYTEVIILAEEKYTSAAKELAQATGATLIILDPLTSGKDAGAYIRGMNKNFDAMENYLNNA